MLKWNTNDVDSKIEQQQKKNETKWRRKIKIKKKTCRPEKRPYIHPFNKIYNDNKREREKKSLILIFNGSENIHAVLS